VLREELEMSEHPNQKKVASKNGLILLGIMGIIGLIFLALGVFEIVERALILGVILLILGFVTYFIFILIERKLKLL
jgi:amino acid transporter